MQIGNFVLYDKGQKEGRLITVVGATASIMTGAGPVQWPMSDVKEAPVKVVELSDEVGVEEEMTIVQRPVPSYEEVPAIEGDDGDAEGHAADRAEEARRVLSPEEAAKLKPPSEKFVTEPLDEPALPPAKTPFEQCAEEAEQLRKENPNPEVVLKGTPHGDIPVNPETYKELVYGGNEPVQPPQAPPGVVRPGLLDDFGKKPEPPEGALEDHRPFGTAIGDQGYPEPTPEDPAPPENVRIEDMELPGRFGKKWLEEQSTPLLRALLNRQDLSKARLGKIRDEIDRRDS